MSNGETYPNSDVIDPDEIMRRFRMEYTSDGEILGLVVPKKPLTTCEQLSAIKYFTERELVMGEGLLLERPNLSNDGRDERVFTPLGEIMSFCSDVRVSESNASSSWRSTLGPYLSGEVYYPNGIGFWVPSN